MAPRANCQEGAYSHTLRPAGVDSSVFPMIRIRHINFSESIFSVILREKGEEMNFFKLLLFTASFNLFPIFAVASGQPSVQGQGSNRRQENAEYKAEIDARKKCLDLTGHSGVNQLQAFTLETTRPYDTGLFYITATAPFACTGQM